MKSRPLFTFLAVVALAALAPFATTQEFALSKTRPYAIYDVACSDALRFQLPLVVGINVNPPAGYWCSCQVASLPGFPSGTIQVFLPKSGALLTAATLAATATATDVQNAVNRGLPTSQASCPDCKSTLCLCVPAEATVTIDGQATTATGTQRRFITPCLEAGSKYCYCLVVTVGGWKCEQRVTFEAGKDVCVCFPGCGCCGAPGCNCGANCTCNPCPGNGCCCPGGNCATSSSSAGSCGPNGCPVYPVQQGFSFQPMMMQPMFFGGFGGGGGCSS